MEEEGQSAPVKSGGIGCGKIIIIALITLILIGIGGNEALGYYFSHCQEEDLIDCFLNRAEEPEPKGTVAAVGVYSYKDYSVTLTANIPLDGGKVTGSVSGTCEGTLIGTFDGQNNGQISGTIAAACSPFFVNIPASATFTGVVNKDGKIVPINFSGSGGGLTHKDSMTLKY